MEKKKKKTRNYIQAFVLDCLSKLFLIRNFSKVILATKKL